MEGGWKVKWPHDMGSPFLEKSESTFPFFLSVGNSQCPLFWTIGQTMMEEDREDLCVSPPVSLTTMDKNIHWRQYREVEVVCDLCRRLESASRHRLLLSSDMYLHPSSLVRRTNALENHHYQLQVKMRGNELRGKKNKRGKEGISLSVCQICISLPHTQKDLGV